MQEQILENRESFEKQSKDFEDAIKLGRKQSRTERLSSLKVISLKSTSTLINNTILIQKDSE